MKQRFAAIARAVARAVAGTAGVALLALLVFASSVPTAAPSPFADVKDGWCPSDVSVLDRHGAPLRTIRTDSSVRRLSWTPLADVSSALDSAVLASEDRRFFDHGGVDWRALAAASWQRASGGSRRGASTIAMQVAALLDPALRRGSAGRSLFGKWDQMRAAWRLEGSWTKDEVLEAYLNLVTFRGEVQGVHAAADAIFAKDAHGLTPAESAVLAASLRAPNASAGALKGRALALTAVMAEATTQPSRDPAGGTTGGTATGEAAIDDAVARAINRPQGTGPRQNSALHAARRLAADAEPCRDIPSSLDAVVQRTAEEALARRLGDLRDRSAHDGAVLVVDNATGEVLAYVGSSGALSKAAQVDGVRARRQAGSTLKPFLYASAIEKNLITPATLLEDKPLDVAVDGGVYRPANYDETFRGLVSARTALAASLNVPAVRTLLLVGDNDFADTLRSLGVASVDQKGSFYGPSLALGSADVSLWEMVAAYRALASGGLWSPLRWKINPDKPETRRVFSAATAYLIGDILSDRASRSTTFGLDSVLATPFWSAVKTGTSKDMRDNWCIGFSSRYTVGVWVGNFGGESMRDVSGVSGAAPVWEDVMALLHAQVPSDAPPVPDDIVEAWTAFARGAEPARSERYRRGTEPVSAPELDTQPRITSPTGGSILALDPDIPPSKQRVSFVVHAPIDSLAWKLDGAALGGAAAPLLWEPTAGRHELLLLDAAGKTLDAVKFEVRGSAPGRSGAAKHTK